MNDSLEIILVLFWAGYLGLNAWLMLVPAKDAARATDFVEGEAHAPRHH